MVGLQMSSIYKLRLVLLSKVHSVLRIHQARREKCSSKMAAEMGCWVAEMGIPGSFRSDDGTPKVPGGFHSPKSCL